MLADMHNHTTWSDGDNTVDDLIHRAALHGLTKIGISDHLEMLPNLDVYMESIIAARQKYPTVQVLIGVEMHISTLLSLVDDCLGQWNTLDYLLIEHLEFQQDIPLALFLLDKMLLPLECRIGMAHLDLERLGQHRDMVLNFIKDHNIFLDFNFESTFYSNILNGYHDIVDVLDKGVSVEVGSDTHSIEEDWYALLKAAHKHLGRSF